MNAISRIVHFAQTQVARFKMRWAALRLFRDYKTDPELTAFEALDGEEFFEDDKSPYPLICLPKASADHHS